MFTAAKAHPSSPSAINTNSVGRRDVGFLQFEGLALAFQLDDPPILIHTTQHTMQAVELGPGRQPNNLDAIASRQAEAAPTWVLLASFAPTTTATAIAMVMARP